MKNNEILNKLKNTEESVYFTYGDGKKFEGWVLEVRGQSLLVSWKPSPIYAQSQNRYKFSKLAFVSTRRNH